jgi:hypothetical protein
MGGAEHLQATEVDCVNRRKIDGQARRGSQRVADRLFQPSCVLYRQGFAQDKGPGVSRQLEIWFIVSP